MHHCGSLHANIPQRNCSLCLQPLHIVTACAKCPVHVLEEPGTSVTCEIYTLCRNVLGGKDALQQQQGIAEATCLAQKYLHTLNILSASLYGARKASPIIPLLRAMIGLESFMYQACSSSSLTILLYYICNNIEICSNQLYNSPGHR